MTLALNPHWRRFARNYGKTLLFYFGVGCFYLYFLYTFEQPFRPSAESWISVSFMLLLLIVTYHARRTAVKYGLAFAAFLCSLYALHTGMFDLDRVLGAMYLSMILYASLLPHAFGAFFLPIGYLWWFLKYAQDASVLGSLIEVHTLGLVANFVTVNSLFLVIRRLQKQRDVYRRRSHTEPLTGLFSSEYMLRTGRKWIREKRSFRLYMIDLDRFKQVNDTYGHKAGDDILKRVSYVLMELAILNGGIASRMGGDEFVVLVPDSLRTAALSERLRRRLENELFVESSELSSVSVQFSIGEVLSKAGAVQSFEELLGDADAAMYRMKFERRTLQLDGDTEKYISSTMLRHLLQSLWEKDSPTYMHSKLTAETALRFAKRLRLCEGKTRHLMTACWFHDVGNMLVPSYLLQKPGPLREEECAVLKEHVNHGIRMLEGLGVHEESLQAIAVHHERWDGKGYPLGMRGSETPKAGRILQIVNAYTVMTSGSLFRERASAEEALAEIERGAGTRYDPELAIEFVKMERELADAPNLREAERPMVATRPAM